MKKFAFNLLLFTLIIFIADVAWNKLMPEQQIPSVPFIVTFFAVTTYLFHLLSVNYSRKKPQAFIRFYMAGTMLRMLIYVSIIAVYRFIDRSAIIVFAIAFFAHYICFTIFEIPTLLKQLRNQNPG